MSRGRNALAKLQGSLIRVRSERAQLNSVPCQLQRSLACPVEGLDLRPRKRSRAPKRRDAAILDRENGLPSSSHDREPTAGLFVAPEGIGFGRVGLASEAIVLENCTGTIAGDAKRHDGGEATRPLWRTVRSMSDGPITTAPETSGEEQKRGDDMNAHRAMWTG